MVEQYPFFTIGIPVYNRINFIKKAIQSVLNQNYTNFELVLVDNKSTDGTWKYLKSINDQRVRIFQNETNIGMIPNFRRCVEEANGKWFKFLMSDDYLVLDALDYLKDIISSEGEDATYIANGFGNRELYCAKKIYPYIVHDTEKILQDRKKYIYGRIPAMPNSYTLLTSDLKKMIKTEEYREVEIKYGQTGHCVDYFIFYFIAKWHPKIVEISKPLYVIITHENNGYMKYIDDFKYHIIGDIFMNEKIFIQHQKVDFYILKHMLSIFINKNRANKSIQYFLKTSAEFIEIVKEINK